jgi:LmbE family N-acetylglucosaminyl deacetylase
MFGAHPDDCELKAGGTAALFASLGAAVKMISMTNGNAGHHLETGAKLADRRMLEACEAGRILGVTSEIGDNNDGQLMPSLENRDFVIKKIREWNADIVITHRPNDYHPDHRYTSILVQDAAFLVTVPGLVQYTPALQGNPLFLYFQDGFSRPAPFHADIAIDITPVIGRKIEALNAHTSQMYEWLPWIGHYEEQVPKEAGPRIEWLMRTRASAVTPPQVEALTRWYGLDRALAATHAEAFEICEYGKKTDAAGIRNLFPMLATQ